MTGDFDLEALNDVLAKMPKGAEPRALILGTHGIAMVRAHEHVEPYSNANADWRRIKREFRKGFRKGLAEARAQRGAETGQRRRSAL